MPTACWIRWRMLAIVAILHLYGITSLLAQDDLLITFREPASSFQGFVHPDSQEGQIADHENNHLSSNQKSFLPDYGDIVTLPGPSHVDFRDDNSIRTAEVNRKFQLYRSTASLVDGPLLQQHIEARLARLNEIDNSERIIDDLHIFPAIETNMLAMSPAGLILETNWGVKMMESRDRFRYTQQGPLSYQNFSLGTISRGLMVGPNGGVSSSYRRGRLSINSTAGMMLAYSHRNYSQRASAGFVPVPGAINAPLYLQHKEWNYSKRNHSLAYIADMRLSMSYWMTDRAKINLTLTRTYVSDLYDAIDQTNFVVNSSNGESFGLNPEVGHDAWLDSLQVSVVFQH